jgi:hypothetical protein
MDLQGSVEMRSSPSAEPEGRRGTEPTSGTGLTTLKIGAGAPRRRRPAASPGSGIELDEHSISIAKLVSACIRGAVRGDWCWTWPSCRPRRGRDYLALAAPRSRWLDEPATALGTSASPRGFAGQRHEISRRWITPRLAPNRYQPWQRIRRYWPPVCVPQETYRDALSGLPRHSRQSGDQP